MQYIPRTCPDCGENTDSEEKCSCYTKNAIAKTVDTILSERDSEPENAHLDYNRRLTHA